MKSIVSVCIVCACTISALVAQIEEVPASRSEPGTRMAQEVEGMAESTQAIDTVDESGAQRLSEQGSEQMRSFLTVNTMIIVIIVLIIALAFFLIMRRVRRSKKQ